MCTTPYIYLAQYTKFGKQGVGSTKNWKPWLELQIAYKKEKFVLIDCVINTEK